MRALAAFARLSRPLFLYGGVAGVALGAAVAAWTGRPLDPASYLCAQGMVTAFQLMVHYANDYFDREGDRGARRTSWSGGSGVLTDGALAPRTALIAAIACAALGLAAAARFGLVGDAPAAALGAAILVLAWSYSAPPARLSGRGLGELDTVAVVAVLVPCEGYAAFAGTVDTRILSAVVGPAAAMFAMMLAVELPDAAADAAARKRTLLVRWGPSQAWRAISLAAAIGTATAAAEAVKVDGGAGLAVMLPGAVAVVQLIRTAHGDPRPATIAFWGVALYALIVTGLAVAYGLAATAR